MATRRPIVLVSGVQSELPFGDTITTGANLVAISGIFSAGVETPVLKSTSISGSSVESDTGTFSNSLSTNTLTSSEISSTSINSTSISGTSLLYSSGVFNSGVTAGQLSPTGSSVPENGIYLASANRIGVATAASGFLFVNDGNSISIGAPVGSGVVTIDTSILPSNNKLCIQNSVNFESATAPNYYDYIEFRGDKQNRYSGSGPILGPLAAIGSRYATTTAVTDDNDQGAGALSFKLRPRSNDSVTDGLVEKAVLNDLGRFGVNTPLPTVELDIVGNARLGPDTNHAFQVTEDSGNNFLVLGASQRTSSTTPRNIKFQGFGSGASDDILILDTSTGNVGVGDPSPSSALSVYASGVNALTVSDPTGAILDVNTSRNVVLGAAANYEQLSLTENYGSISSTHRTNRGIKYDVVENSSSIVEICRFTVPYNNVAGRYTAGWVDLTVTYATNDGGTRSAVSIAHLRAWFVRGDRAGNQFNTSTTLQFIGTPQLYDTGGSTSRLIEIADFTVTTTGSAGATQTVSIKFTPPSPLASNSHVNVFAELCNSHYTTANAVSLVQL